MYEIRPNITPANLPVLSANDFESAGRAVLQFLRERMAFDLWMLTRTEGEDWIVLQMENSGYNVEPRSVFRWADSMCSRMVQGQGPRIAPRSDDILAYVDAPVSRQLKIGAYVGVPLTLSDGSLFGTLCGIHPTPQSESIRAELPLIELLAGMLSTLLNSELNLLEARRLAERAGAQAEADALTGLFNRRGWDRLIAFEEERCLRYGHPACVLAIDLDRLKAINDTKGHAAGDELICLAAEAIRGAARVSDVAARVGGDEFVVMAAECDASGARDLAACIREALAKAGVSASVGMAMRIPATGLVSAWREADEAMYREKVRESTPLRK